MTTFEKVQQLEAALRQMRELLSRHGDSIHTFSSGGEVCGFENNGDRNYRVYAPELAEWLREQA